MKRILIAFAAAVCTAACGGIDALQWDTDSGTDAGQDASADGGDTDTDTGSDTEDTDTGTTDTDVDGGDTDTTTTDTESETEDTGSDTVDTDTEPTCTEYLADSVNGIMWVNSAMTGSGLVDWSDAVAYCDSLDFCGYDDWRLPSLTELRTLVRGCANISTGGECAAGDGCTASACWSMSTCNSCTQNAGPDDGCYWSSDIADDCMSAWYWASDELSDDATQAWFVAFNAGAIHYWAKTTVDYMAAKCVRSL